MITVSGGQMAVPPNVCRHDSGESAEAIMDGKGNVIGHHYRCNACNLIIRTEMS